MSEKSIDQMLEEIRNTHRPTFEERLDNMSLQELRQALEDSRKAVDAYKQGSGRISHVYQLATREQLEKQEVILKKISSK